MRGAKLNPCRWCGKHNRNASGWEQWSVVRKVWMPLCVRCRNRRLDNPFSTATMREVGQHDHRP